MGTIANPPPRLHPDPRAARLRPMRTELFVTDSARALDGAEALVIIGRVGRLSDDDVRALLPADAADRWDAMLEATKPGDKGSATCTWLSGDGPKRVVAGVLPEACSRHNSAARPHAITSLVSSHAPKTGEVTVLLALNDTEHATAAVTAVARALPLYSRKTEDESTCRVRVACICEDSGAIDEEWLSVLAEETRFAARLVDMPTNELSTNAFVDLARETAAKLNTEVMVIEGESLAHAGFGGIWGVGKAATDPPAMVVLDYKPENPAKDAKTVVWVGKGIVYDTGGLTLKPKTGMPGMKTDMGGAAAVLAGFRAAVRLGAEHRLIAILCIAENAIGPDATRNDDILTMYSGRTVEINNTDAEGRLVLADGVAYAVREYNPDVLMDLATLTGAQLVSTGRRHAAILCNDEALEAKAVAVGLQTGELVHPIPYCPEFFRGEFKSVVADMKNSVKDRMNAQSSCAGQFVGEHLGDYKNAWLHIDLAGPSRDGERATGFGPTLLVELLQRL